MAGRPAAERLLGPFDVLHFTRLDVPAAARAASARRRSTTSCRSASRSGRRADARDARPQVRERGADVRRHLRQLRFTADDVTRAARRRPRSGSASRRPGVGRGLHGRGAGAPTSGAPYLLTRRDARAAQEPRDAASRRTRCSAAGSCSPSRAGRAGASSRSSTTRRRRARLRPRRGAAAALPRRRRVRLSLALRGVRDADRRGDGVRRAGGRLVAPVDGRGVRGTRPSAPIPTIRRRSRRGSSGRSRSATSSRARGLAHAARFTWRAAGEAHARGVRGGAR